MSTQIYLMVQRRNASNQSAPDEYQWVFEEEITFGALEVFRALGIDPETEDGTCGSFWPKEASDREQVRVCGSLIEAAASYSNSNSVNQELVSITFVRLLSKALQCLVDVEYHEVTGIRVPKYWVAIRWN